jgi:hypothetical protein
MKPKTIDSVEFFLEQAEEKFLKGKKEHCKCENTSCKCWENVNYKEEALAECYDLFNYLCGLSKYNKSEMIDPVLNIVVRLHELILLLNGDPACQKNPLT